MIELSCVLYLFLRISCDNISFLFANNEMIVVWFKRITGTSLISGVVVSQFLSSVPDIDEKRNVCFTREKFFSFQSNDQLLLSDRREDSIKGSGKWSIIEKDCSHRNHFIRGSYIFLSVERPWNFQIFLFRASSQKTRREIASRCSSSL